LIKYKKAFALLIVLGLLISFSFLSINIIQNRTYSNQIDKLKYLELQAKIHMKYIKENITNNPQINDDRFNLKIIQENNDSKTYHIYLKTKELNHISLYEKIII